MKTHIFYRNLLLLLYIVVVLSQTYFNEGSLISQLSKVIIIVISSVYFVKCQFFKYKNLFFNCWTIFLILNILCFIFTATFSNKMHYGMFLSILITFLSFYPFYYFTRYGHFTEKQLRVFLLLMIPVFIYSFYSTQSRLLMERLIDENVVNNVSYSFVALMPVVFLIRKKILSVTILVFLMFFIIQGAKRGAMFGGGLIIIVYFYHLIKHTNKKNNSLRLLGVLSLILVSMYLGYHYYLSNEFVIDRMSKITEGGSGRDFIYTKILNYWYHSDNLLKYFFGFGFAYSLKITNGLFAHNDWLELLSNIGLVGVSAYLVLYYSSIKVFKDYKWISVEKYLLLSVMLVWLLSSMVSMWYTNTQGYLYSILLAYLVAVKGKTINKNSFKNG